MPLIANTDLPSFARLRAEGQELLDPARATSQDIRELHIGFLNMMPDAALQATERQFLRLIGSCNRIAQFYVHPFTFAEIPRDKKTRAHIKQYYCDIKELQQAGLDALIISGANPAKTELTAEPFWRPLTELIAWASENVCSVMCSCLATHAIVQLKWQIARYRLPQKRWGVFSHRITANPHPLTANINTRFDAPHSHLYEVNAAQFNQAGLIVLAAGDESDLHLATSAEGLRFVFFQGHPEYDAISLLKEYRREVGRFVSGERTDYPPLPQNYFTKNAKKILHNYKQKIIKAKQSMVKRSDQINLTDSIYAFPESELLPTLDNTWTDSGKAIVNNWLGLIYQLAHPDRGKVFMDGINPADPLGINSTKP